MAKGDAAVIDRVRELVAALPAAASAIDAIDAIDGARALVVGGAVRDAILGRETEDIDLLVAGVPLDLLMERLASAGEVDLVGRSFGVVKFRPGNDPEAPQVDVALPRTEHPSEGAEGGYRDVDAAPDPSLSVEDDLARRDFTVNAMAVDLSSGELIDPHGGLCDALDGIVRAVGNPAERFAEDHSRVLRALRFATALGFEIEARTWEAVLRFAPALADRRLGGGLIVPREVSGAEVEKMLHADPARAGRLLLYSGALEALFPDVGREAVERPGYMRPLDRLPPGDATLAAAVLLRHAGSKGVAAAARRSGLGCTGRSAPWRVDTAGLRWHLRTAEAGDPEWLCPSAFERAFMRERSARHLAFLRAIGREAEADAAEARIREIRDIVGVREGPIPRLLSGKDVIERLGIPEGPGVRAMLEIARDAQLDGRVRTREEVIELLRPSTPD